MLNQTASWKHNGWEITTIIPGTIKKIKFKKIRKPKEYLSKI